MWLRDGGGASLRLDQVACKFLSSFSAPLPSLIQLFLWSSGDVTPPVLATSFSSRAPPAVAACRGVWLKRACSHKGVCLAAFRMRVSRVAAWPKIQIQRLPDASFPPRVIKAAHACPPGRPLRASP